MFAGQKFDQPFGNIETQARTAKSPGVAVVDLPELFKNQVNLEQTNVRKKVII